MLSSKFTVAIGLLCACAQAAFAVPVTLDGNIDGNDTYDFRLEDPNEGPIIFGGSSWDIDAVEFTGDNDWFYVGLDTMDTFDRNGGDFAFPPQTQFLFQLSDTDDSFLFILALTDSSELLYLDGVGFLADPQFDVETGSDMELRLDVALLAGLDAEFDFIARLDNSALPADDIIEGRVPEPATVVLLAAGGLLVFARRRKS